MYLAIATFHALEEIDAFLKVLGHVSSVTILQWKLNVYKHIVECVFNIIGHIHDVRDPYTKQSTHIHINIANTTKNKSCNERRRNTQLILLISFNKLLPNFLSSALYYTALH